MEKCGVTFCSQEINENSQKVVDNLGNVYAHYCEYHARQLNFFFVGEYHKARRMGFELPRGRPAISLESFNKVFEQVRG